LKVIESAALLVRSVPYGEADVVATFFTEVEGKVAAMVRGARRSTKRFGGTLEPMHELVVRFEDRGRELCVLKEARIGRAREGIVSSLASMEMAGRALRWVRHVCPAKTPEPAAWLELRALLDSLDSGVADECARLVVFGVRLLSDVGYGLEFERCVRCAKPCPEGRSAFVDASGGGIVCVSCGGAERTMPAELRVTAVRLQRREEGVAMTVAAASELLSIVEDAMAAHTGYGPLSI